MRSEALEKAYRATGYRVFLPGGVVELRVDEASDGLRRWLAEVGDDGWAILTAHNPGGGRLSAEVNAERQSELECRLLEKGCDPYAGENIADDDTWPVEETCLVSGLPLPDCLALAATFGQNAIVCGGADAVPRLIWLDGQ